MVSCRFFPEINPFGPVQEWSWTGQSQKDESQAMHGHVAASGNAMLHGSACETKPTHVLVH